MSLNDADKEKIKLRASFINNLGIGVFLVGFFTPITRLAYDVSISPSTVALVAGTSLVCFPVSFVLHLYAIGHLNELDL